MEFQLIHFRDAEKIIEEKAMVSDVAMTMEYVFNTLQGSLYRGELLRMALDEMGWRENGALNVLPGRRYQYKGFKRGVAIDGSFAAYEYIIEGLMRLQIGFDKGNARIRYLDADRQTQRKQSLWRYREHGDRGR